MVPPRSRKIQYIRCSDNELEKFCTDRGIPFSPLPPHSSDRQHRQNRRQHRQECIDFLETADANPGPFRFLDLAPELRTAIYEDLLVFDNSFTCYTQILQASKQVNDEATNILYGDNLIDLKFQQDGMSVHGQKIGDIWPEFLLKVQFLRISYGLQSTTFQEDNEFTSKCTTWLLELCKFLAGYHMLRSVNICFTHAPSAPGLPSYDAPYDVYALRILGPLKECVVEGVNGIYPVDLVDWGAPLRVEKPEDMTASDAWLPYYHVCLDRWDDFAVDCYRYRASLGPGSSKRVYTLLSEIRAVVRDHSRRPPVMEGDKKKTYLLGLKEAHGAGTKVPLSSRVITRFSTLSETERAYGNFVAFFVYFKTYMASRRIPQTMPKVFQEFFHFYIDARLARFGCEDKEMYDAMFGKEDLAAEET